MVPTNPVNHLCRWKTESGVLVAVIAVTVLAETLGAWTLATLVGVGVRPLALVVVLGTVTVGVIARWGFAVGLLLTGLVLGDWTGGVISAFAAFAGTVVCSRVGLSRSGEADRHRWVVQYCSTATLTTVALATTAGWLSDALGVATFSIVIEKTLATGLPLALLGAPLAWRLTERAGNLSRGHSRAVASRRDRLLLAGVFVLWVTAGYAASFLYRWLSTIPEQMIATRLGYTVETIVRIGGPQGCYIVFSIGVVAAITLFLWFRTGRFGRPP